MINFLKSIIAWAIRISRRPIFRMTIAYLSVSAVLITVANAVLPSFGIEWAFNLIVFLVVIQYPIALLITWGLEITPYGIDTIHTSRVSSKILLVSLGLIGILSVGSIWYMYRGQTDTKIVDKIEKKIEISSIGESGREIKQKFDSLQKLNDSLSVLAKKNSRRKDSLLLKNKELRRNLDNVENSKTNRNMVSKSKIIDLRKENNGLEQKISSLGRKISDLKKDNKKLSRKKTEIEKKLYKRQTKCSNLIRKEKYKGTIKRSSVYPQGYEDIEIGMNISDIKEKIKTDEIEITSGWLSVGFDDGPISGATYYHTGKSNDPKVEWIKYKFRNGIAKDIITKEALCKYGYESAKIEVQGKKVTWKDKRGFQIEIREDFPPGSYKLKKSN